MPSSHRTSDPRPLIVHVVSGMNIGGVARVILSILDHADHTRYRTGVVCLRSEGEWADEVRARGATLHACKVRPQTNPFRILHLAGLFRRLRPDLLHIHNPPNTLPAGTAARFAGRIPYILHYHNASGPYTDRATALIRAWERRVIRGAAEVVAVSTPTARSMAELFDIPAERFRVIINGVATRHFREANPTDPRAAWGFDLKRPLVIMVARLVDFKRPLDFISAAGYALRNWPASGAPRPAFALVGDGPLRGDCIKAVRDAGLNRDLVVPGSREDVPAVLRSANLGVLTSSDAEGCSLVILEYMAAGLPIAAYALESVREILEDKKTAALAPESRPDLLGARIRELILNPEAAGNLVNRVDAEVLPKRDWAGVVAAYEAIYKRILDSRRPR